MKRLLASLLAVMTLVSVVPTTAFAQEDVASTEPTVVEEVAVEQIKESTEADTGDIVTVTGELTCSEDEFREILAKTSQSLSSTRSRNAGSGLHSRGYYYTYLANNFEHDVYEACYKKIGAVNVEASLDTDALNGLRYDSTTFENKLDTLVQQLFKAAWSCRYDNIAESDIYTCSVAASYSYSYNRSTRKVDNTTFTVIYEAHPYYNSSLIATRDARIKQIAGIANTEPTVYKKMKRVYEEIIKTSYYDFRDQALEAGYADTQIFFRAHSSFGILNYGVGVCESYAKAFKLVCDYMGLAPTVCLTSQTHMWNAVYYDGQWYGVDATWDDPGDSNVVYYEYFLSNDPDDVDGSATDHISESLYGDGIDYAPTPYNPANHRHSMTKISYIAPTYTETGRQEHYKCSVCWGLYKDINGRYATTAAEMVIPKLVDDGTCHHSYTKVLPAIPATTTSAGQTALVVCAYCGHSQGERQEIPAIASVSTEYDIYSCTGKTITPSVIALDTDGNEIDDEYYSVSYSGSRRAPGTYSVTVRFTGNYAGSVSDTYKIEIKDPELNFSSTTSKITLSWKKLTGASGYKIYNSKKRTLRTTTGSSYSISRLSSGTTYSYYIKAYYKISGKTYYSDYVKISAATCPKAPSISTSTTSSRITYSWKKVTGASGYAAYDSSKQLLRDDLTTAGAYMDNLNPGQYKTLYFRAYKDVSGRRLYSSYVKVTRATRPQFSTTRATITTGSSVYLSSLLESESSSIKWSTSNSRIATVSSSGKVTGKKYGTVTITAAVGSSKATIRVTVATPNVNINYSSISLKPFYYRNLTATTNKTGATIRWSTSNSRVATVDSYGKVTGRGLGTATITAYIKVGSKTYKDTCRVTVTIPTYSAYGYPSVPDFSAAIGNYDYCADYVYDDSDLYLLYMYEDIISGGDYSDTLEIYEEYLRMKGFSYVDYYESDTMLIFTYRKSSLYVDVVITSDGDVMIVIY